MLNKLLKDIINKMFGKNNIYIYKLYLYYKNYK